MWQAANVNLFIHFFIQYLFNVFHVPVMVLGIPFTVQNSEQSLVPQSL